MKNKNKVIILTSIIIGMLVVTLGITYSVLTFDETKGNSQLVLGDIYMHYNETSGLSIEGMVPGADYSNYFEFTISGKNTYTEKDIYYDFLITRGDLLDGKTEDNRIPDEYLKFKLVKVTTNEDTETEEVLFTDKTYPELANTRVYVETIAKNTTSEVNRKYRLYMTVDNSLSIGNTTDSVFTFDEWEDAFASVKVNVTGDFGEKKIYAYEDCFKLSLYSIDGVSMPVILDYYKYDPSSTDERLLNPLCTSDVVIPSSIKIIEFQAFQYKELTSVEIPNGVKEIRDYAFTGNLLTSVVIPNSVTTIKEGAFAENSLLESLTFEENSNLEIIGKEAFNFTSLESVEIPNSVKIIEEQAFSIDSLTSLTFEENSSLETIGNSAFCGVQIESVEIPNSVTTIGEDAFAGISLASLTFEENSNLETIGDFAFSGNLLTSVEIPNGVSYIGIAAFHSNSKLSSIIIDKTCNEIRSMPDGYYPWLNFTSPYSTPYSESVTIYGSNSEVCDTFTK